MLKRLFVRPEAKMDIREAKEWLDQQKIGLGLDFRGDLNKTFKRISENPWLKWSTSKFDKSS
jgi:hypothetical protein